MLLLFTAVCDELSGYCKPTDTAQLRLLSVLQLRTHRLYSHRISCQANYKIAEQAPEMDCATSRITLHSDDSEQQTTLTPVAERPNSIIIHSRCEQPNYAWNACSLPGVELRSDGVNRVPAEAGYVEYGQ